ncbi:NAD-dependent succinate-semialdehyde dehydrogenase [Aureimonas sp. Leaf454]|uniref:NAD-dependent succinate-semialdehyde dehydrogenase n=1 Tax=Aureimonas sp. Leaf454 TaxID=1736381 RepID=UPI0009EA5AF3|nr:NAD-dependent succinate-semialdehyde dehydrogenase [Aureimonas sp. Leaf454]
MTNMPDLSAYLRETAFVGGAWIEADGGGTVAVTDPATGATLGTVPDCGRAETRRAIEAAKAAFPAWRAKTAKERGALLHKLADLIEAEAKPLATLLTAEQGKSLAEATGEVKFSAAYVRWFAEEAQRVYGDVIPSPWPGRKILVTREPVGVVGAITPWNFPSSMIARKLAPALAAGCTIVIKPAMQTPYSGLAWGVLCERVGIPAGVVSVITGSASEIGAELTESRDVAKITFTGSTPVGKMLVAQCAPTLKRVSMELGGNAPFIVFDDADVERAVAGAMIAKFRNSGQTCVCTNRFLVQSGIHDRFVEALVKAVEALKVGNGLETGTEQGPLIDDRAVAKVEAHIADALEQGAAIATGGHRHALGGTFFQPTVLTGVSLSSHVAKEETFGPIAPVFRFDTEEEAIAMANDTEFGLASYFYTRDLGRAFRVADALKSGMVGINEGLITTEVAPFGGVRESGMGREGSKYGIEDYLDMKYVCLGGLDG